MKDQKVKMDINDLKVTSFVTMLDSSKLKSIKGAGSGASAANTKGTRCCDRNFM